MNQLPTTANEVLSLMASTSTEIDVFSDQIIHSVKSGEQNPVKVLVQIKAMEKVIDRVNKEIKENYLNEADKYPGTSFEFLGNKIEKQDVGTSYDYSHCQDQGWDDLNLLLMSLKDQMKTRETFLKTLQKPLTELNDCTGELNTIYPPLKKSASGLKVTIR